MSHKSTDATIGEAVTPPKHKSVEFQWSASRQLSGFESDPASTFASEALDANMGILREDATINNCDTQVHFNTING